MARAAIVACTVGSIFPDIDVFAGRIFRNPLAMLEWHRNITHSLVLLPMWALLLAGISAPLARRLHWESPGFAKLLGIYAVGLGTHLFLDVITNFGTMIWSPVNYSRLAWDWFFIIDLTFTGIALVPQLAAWCYREPDKFRRRAGVVWAALTVGALVAYALARSVREPFPASIAGATSAVMAAIIFLPAVSNIGFGWRRASWCRAGVALACVYVATAAMAHRTALVYVNDYAAAHHLQVSSLAALPLPPTLTHWSGLVSTPDGVLRTTFHVPGGDPDDIQFYADARRDPAVLKAMQVRDLETYLWFARFPIWQVSRSDAQTVVDVTDARFFGAGVEDPLPAQGAGTAGRRRTGFSFEVVFDTAGRVIFQGSAPEP